jgi:hypothetical protein
MKGELLIHDAPVAEMDTGELGVGGFGSGICPVVRVVPLPASAVRNSTPSGIWIRARCSAPVTGLRIGSPIALPALQGAVSLYCGN